MECLFSLQNTKVIRLYVCINQGRRKVITRGGGQIGSNVGGGADWPKVVFLFLVQGEKCGVGGGGAYGTLAPHFRRGAWPLWPHPFLRPS